MYKPLAWHSNGHIAQSNIFEDTLVIIDFDCVSNEQDRRDVAHEMSRHVSHQWDSVKYLDWSRSELVRNYKTKGFDDFIVLF